MSKDNAIFWICAVVLIAIGMMIGQVAAVTVAAMAAVAIMCRRVSPGDFSSRASASP